MEGKTRVACVRPRGLLSRRRLVALTLAGSSTFLAGCAAPLSGFVEKHTQAAPRVSIDVLRLELAEKPGEQRVQDQLSALEREYAGQLERRIQGALAARDLTRAHILLEGARGYLPAATGAALQGELERGRATLMQSLEPALEAYFAGRFDAYLDDHAETVLADGDNYQSRHIHDRALRRSYEEHVEQATGALGRDELEPARSHVDIALRRFPGDASAAQLAQVIDDEITVERSVAAAGALVLETHAPEHRAGFLMHLQVAENAIPGHRKTERCLSANEASWDAPLLATVEEFLRVGQGDPGDVLAMALLVSRLRTVPAQGTRDLLDGLGGLYRTHCEGVAERQARLENPTLERLARRTSAWDLPAEPGYRVSLVDLEAGRLGDDVHAALRDVAVRVEDSYRSAAEGAPFLVEIELADFQGEVVHEQDRPQEMASEFVSGFEMVANPAHLKLQSQIAEARSDLSLARVTDAAAAKGADYYRDRNDDPFALIGIGMAESLLGNKEKDLNAKITSLEGRLSNTDSELKRDTTASYAYRRQVSRARVEGRFELRVRFPNESVEVREFRFDTEYEDDERFDVHPQDVQGVRSKEARVPDRRALLEELSRSLQQDLTAFLEGELADWLRSPYEGQPSPRWSQDRRREYLALRVIHAARRPDAAERAQLGSFFTERLLATCPGVEPASLVPVLAWDGDRATSLAWTVNDASWRGAGLEPGDQVYACNGQDVRAELTLELLVCEALRTGGELQLGLLRAGEPLELTYRPTTDVAIPSFALEPERQVPRLAER